jgi:hypothetical protein
MGLVCPIPRASHLGPDAAGWGMITAGTPSSLILACSRTSGSSASFAHWCSHPCRIHNGHRGRENYLYELHHTLKAPALAKLAL